MATADHGGRLIVAGPMTTEGDQARRTIETIGIPHSACKEPGHGVHPGGQMR